MGEEFGLGPAVSALSGVCLYTRERLCNSAGLLNALPDAAAPLVLLPLTSQCPSVSVALAAWSVKVLDLVLATRCAAVLVFLPLVAVLSALYGCAEAP